MYSKKRWLLGFVLMVLVAALGWGLRPHMQARAPAGAELAPGSPVASGPSNLTEPAARSAPGAASAQATVQPQDANQQARQRLDREVAEVERQWCSSAKQAHLQMEQAREQSLPKFDPQNPKARVDADIAAASRAESLTEGARRAVSTRLKEQWAQQLDLRGDPASRRVALWLRAPHSAKHSEALKAQALSVGDAQAYALWLETERFCFQGVRCSVADYLRWAQMEPGNLLAWLPVLGDKAPPPPDRWQGLAQARVVRSPLQEAVALLLPLVPTEPGLAMEMGLEYIDYLRSDNDGYWTGRLGQTCEQAVTAEHRSACARAAALLERQQSVSFLQRLSAGLLREAYGENADPRALQARLGGAFKGLSPKQEEALKSLLSPGFRDRLGCDHLPAWRAHLQKLTDVGSAVMVDAVVPPAHWK